MNTASYIITDPKICHGKPTFKGTRIMIWQILEMLSLGSNLSEIQKAFPKITAKQVKASLKYAASLTKGNHETSQDQVPAFSA